MMLGRNLRMRWTWQLKEVIPISVLGGENSCCIFTIQVHGNLASLKGELRIDVSKCLSVWNAVLK